LYDDIREYFLLRPHVQCIQLAHQRSWHEYLRDYR
jgi:hypothetical protein